MPPGEPTSGIAAFAGEPVPGVVDRVRQLARAARPLGEARVLALPALRAVAMVAALAWLGLTPRSFPLWDATAATVAGFAIYSLGVLAAFWLRPALALRQDLVVLAVDLAFALTLIGLTGGVHSHMFLALLLIVGLQSYYYGLARGMGVAAGTAVAYVAVVWPTVRSVEVANLALELVVLAGTAAGVGIIAAVEARERLRIAALTTEAQARERFIRNVVESLREGVVVLDLERRVVAWNPALEAGFGITSAEAVGRDFLACCPCFRRDSLEKPIQALLNGEVEEITLEGVEHETAQEGRIITDLRGSLFRENGQPAGAVLLVEDITQRVALQRSARQAEKLAALGTLAAGLAHELNNPTGIISSRIELMLLDAESRPLPAEVREDLEVLHRHAQRVARIAHGLLSFARQSPGEFGPVDLNDLVEETLLLIERQIAKRGVVVRRSLAAGLPPVRGDSNGLQQVILNLLTNARDALNGGGEIAVETGVAPGRPGVVRLVVRDSGPGIPPEALPRIFDPFFTTKASGTGLGLSISYGIVREHQGTVDVESQPGRGTTFTLTFPMLG